VDAREQQFVEQMGILGESDGLPRIAGRIFAFLLLRRDECSLDDLATALGVSRASISTDARRLAQMGLVERRSRPGDRRDYYAIGPEGVRQLIESRVRAIRRFHALLREGGSLPTLAPEVRARIAAWDAAHQDLLDAFSAVLERQEGRMRSEE
jgi:DNA-binding MarR family transcriptional regulator